jgi:serine protease Do
VNLYQALVDEIVTVRFIREGQERATKVTVVEREDDPMRFAEKADPEKNVVPRLGILGVPLTSDLADSISDLRYPYGIIVALRSTGAAANGLDVGDVIFSVNGTPVKTLEALKSTIDGLSAHAPAVLQVQREDRVRYIVIDIE